MPLCLQGMTAVGDKGSIFSTQTPLDCTFHIITLFSCSMRPRPITELPAFSYHCTPPGSCFKTKCVKRKSSCTTTESLSFCGWLVSAHMPTHTHHHLLHKNSSTGIRKSWKLSGISVLFIPCLFGTVTGLVSNEYSVNINNTLYMMCCT